MSVLKQSGAICYENFLPLLVIKWLQISAIPEYFNHYMLNMAERSFELTGAEIC